MFRRQMDSIPGIKAGASPPIMIISDDPSRAWPRSSINSLMPVCCDSFRPNTEPLKSLLTRRSPSVDGERPKVLYVL